MIPVWLEVDDIHNLTSSSCFADCYTLHSQYYDLDHNYWKWHLYISENRINSTNSSKYCSSNFLCMPKSKYKIKIRDYLISLAISMKRKHWHYHKSNELLAVCKKSRSFCVIFQLSYWWKICENLNFDMGQC